MSLVAVDRWAAIFVPKKRLDMLKCIILTLFIWVISFCVAGPYIYYSEVCLIFDYQRMQIALSEKTAGEE